MNTKRIDWSINVPTLLTMLAGAIGIVYGVAQRDSQLEILRSDAAVNKIDHATITANLKNIVDQQHQLAITIENLSVRVEERTKKPGT